MVNVAEEAKMASEGVKAPSHAAIFSICKSLAAGGIAGGVLVLYPFFCCYSYEFDTRSGTAVVPLERLKILLQIPYVGLYFAVYESLKDWLVKTRPFGLTQDTELSVTTKLGCGAVAGTIGQTVAYPLDVICRRMQMGGWKNAASVVIGDGKSKAPVEYSGTVDAFRKTVRHEGVGALFKGLVPNSVKVVPSIGIAFVTYEVVKDILGVEMRISD
ncbi:hypothetical protein K7X08_029468 [Anisodus acutangulus]|uniref:Mitochondrial carrier protein n=1 Tax=Anisodus acutangulus TaxID=402998 RepID=A0A9Q1L4N4_9SOLA|nr:hypothetical protein K7X08_029468 [Anisodus acutangulus]